MRFSTGMMGVMVVGVALALAVLGAWALSTDVTERETTIYNELTEITPLFGSEPSPEYVSYTPILNYTGYYTDNSTRADTHYFDGVDYDRSARANTYKLNLMYTSHTYDITDLSGITSTTSFDLDVDYWPSNNDYNKIQNVSKISLTQLIEDLGLDTYTKVTFTNTDPDYSESESFVTFAVSTDMVGGIQRTYYMKDPSLTGDLQVGASIFGAKRAASDTNNVVLAAEVDVSAGLVTLYAGAEGLQDPTETFMASPVGTFDASMVYLLWGGSSGLLYDFELGDSVVYNAYTFPATTYMDPTQGVALE